MNPIRPFQRSHHQNDLSSKATRKITTTKKKTTRNITYSVVIMIIMASSSSSMIRYCAGFMTKSRSMPSPALSTKTMRRSLMAKSYSPDVASSSSQGSIFLFETQRRLSTLETRRHNASGRHITKNRARLFVSTNQDVDDDDDDDETARSRKRMSSSSPAKKSSTESRVNSKNKPSSKEKKKGKIQLKELTPDRLDKLLAAFDDFARKDGFDKSMSYTANDAKFEEYDFGDDFEDGDSFDDDEEFLDDEDDDDVETVKDLDDPLGGETFTLADFEEGNDDEEEDDDDDYIDFGDDDDGRVGGGDIDNNSMAARIAQARKDMVKGTVSIPEELDRFAKLDNARRLGFRSDDYEDEDQRPKQIAKLIVDAMTCSACGSPFQASDEHKPGYLPREKFDIQVKLSRVEELRKLQEKAESQEWSTDDEIEWLLQTQGKGETAGSGEEPVSAADIDIDAVADELGLDLEQVATKKVICKRCHSLQNFGKVEESLRPGWTEEPTLSQEQFRELLRPISQKPAVVIALIDLFDFSGSVLRELDGIAGDNPVIVAANKADLLPSQMGKQRVENWVRRELEYMGVRSLANIGGAVRLVSCKTGEGVADMLRKARELAEVMDGDVYVVGAANAGKSTLINNILSRNQDDQNRPLGKIRAGNRNALKGAVTTSPLPGTTLKFIKIDLGDGRSLYDTPGLLVPGTITQLLTPEELKIVCPKKKVEPITFRVASGKCVLVGGLAKIEVIGDSKPFLLTFFVANDIKLHPTDSSRADEFVAKHAGEILTPPLAPGPERMEQIGTFDSHAIEIEGAGWKEAAADITLTGLGWVAVTGAGRAKIRISVPPGIGVSVRPPLMPFDIWEVAAKYTGGRAVRKASKTKTGKKRKGVGRS